MRAGRRIQRISVQRGTDRAIPIDTRVHQTISRAVVLRLHRDNEGGLMVPLSIQVVE